MTAAQPLTPADRVRRALAETNGHAPGHDEPVVDTANPGPDGPPPADLPPNPATVAFISAELGLQPELAALLAPAIEDRAKYERNLGLARRLVRDQQLARDADFDGIDVVTAAQLLERERPPRAPVFGDLVQEGHNVTVVARYKTGKSTVCENMVEAATTGGNLFGRYPAPKMRVAYLNYELDERDMDARIRRLHLDREAQERLLVINLRGRRLPIMTAPGRTWLTGQLAQHRTELLIVDPFGAAYASAGGESENDNAEVRRFTTALDEVKRLASVGTMVMPVHTGRAEQEEGDERGRGATVIDDWPDVQMFLTKDKDGARFLRTDGRAPYRLDESRLGFDERHGRLMLATTDLGLNRSRAKRQTALDAVTRVLRSDPGLNTRQLRDALAKAGVTNNDDKDTATKTATADELIHIHDGPGRAVLHYLGQPHGDDEPCPEGWTP